MTQTPLFRRFNLNAHDDGADCSVHYIWINHSPDSEGKLYPCSISLENIDIAHENARRYPAASVNIWVDFGLLDTITKKHLQQHHNAHAPQNVTLRDINDITPYADDPLFKPMAFSGMYGLWSRVDYARLLVVGHALFNDASTYVIYSDFDTPDISLGFAKKKMDKYGVAIGTNGYMKPGHSLIENSYLGFKNTDLSLTRICALINSTGASVHRGRNGYDDFIKWVDDLAKEHDVFTGRQMTIKRLAQNMKYQVPKNPKYKGITHL